MTNYTFRAKEKEELRQTEQSPNTSVSSMSPLSDRSENPVHSGGPQPAATSEPAPAPAAAPVTTPTSTAPLETMRHLQTVSHRGYGASVASWNGHHSNLGRQVF